MQGSKRIFLFILLLAIILSLSACTRISSDNINDASEVFSKNNMPVSFLNKVSEAEAIVIGQYKGIKEHQDLLADLTIHQHKNSNIDIVVLGSRHAYSWIFNSYVKGELNSDLFVEEVTSDWVIFLSRIREYNKDLSDNNKISVKTGDINSQEDQFVSSLQYMRQQLPERDTVNRLLNRIISAADRTEVLIEFKNILSNNSSNFSQSWGSDWNKILIEMIEVEIASTEIREMWDLDYTEAHILREDLIKELAEKRLENNNNIIFNYSFYQAQKNHYLGTRKEWLAGYLNSEDSSIETSYSFLFIPMSGQIFDGEDGIMNIDISIEEDNGLFKRTVDLIGSDKQIYIDFHFDQFKNKKDDLNLYYQKIEAVPYNIFDGAILMPKASLINY